jgi:proteasome assembly chaperone (PAC2) family protein
LKGTFVKELAKVELKNPIMIERLPGLGLVGKIAARYLIKQLKAQKFASLLAALSIFCAREQKGSVRPLRGTFYFWKNEKGEND